MWNGHHEVLVVVKIKYYNLAAASPHSALFYWGKIYENACGVNLDETQIAFDNIYHRGVVVANVKVDEPTTDVIWGFVQELVSPASFIRMGDGIGCPEPNFGILMTRALAEGGVERYFFTRTTVTKEN